MIKFKVVKSVAEINEIDTVYLISDNWDDWFTYSTVFNMYYNNDNNERIYICGVKIGQKNQQGRTPILPEKFTQLSEEFFSLGSKTYYSELKNIDSKYKIRESILKGLNDIAFNLEYFEKVKNLDVTQVSLLRDKSERMVRNQYSRLAHGGAWLTKYNFNYALYNNSEDKEDKVELTFEINPKKTPPTNIHVIIGKNGVGKTTLLKNMLLSLESEEDDERYGIIDTKWSNDFANIVYVSFSAFDKYIEIENEIIPYLYIGLVKKDGIKNQEEFSKDFAESLFEITNGNKKKLWNETISILESDNTFIELNIKSWSEVNYFKKDSIINELEKKNQEVNKSIAMYNKQVQKTNFVEKIIPKFETLSSGHKVILLTVAKLIENVEEKTLVLLDEPEEHLHPPLVSAFIRALSKLLIFRNGVGIIATHSPVIVQEVPKKCVWLLRRANNKLVADRPKIETFGENLGVLTSEIFGFEITNSGFHKMLNDIATKENSYDDVLDEFNNELGEEGKSILRSLMYEKEQLEGEYDD